MMEEQKQSEQFSKLSLEELQNKQPGLEADDGVGTSIFKDISKLKKQSFEKVHKDSITSIHIVVDEEAKMQKIISTSLDGFIKMIDSRDGQIKKAFFVS
jgi:hypothetical protein